MEKVAREFPATKFAIIDAVVDLPNVQSIVFKEHEGSFLVGMAAAMASKTGKVGFVGGMDIPLIRKFALGYDEGARYVNPKIEIFQNMTGTTPDVFFVHYWKQSFAALLVALAALLLFQRLREFRA